MGERRGGCFGDLKMEGWDGNKGIVLLGQRCEEDVVGEEARRESCEAVILEICGR